MSSMNKSFVEHSEGCCLLLLLQQLCTVVGAIFIAKWILYLLCRLWTVLRVILSSYLWKRNLVAEYGGKWAVVTGSTDGIGKEYARQLAQRGMNIVLVSRTLEKLKEVEQEIRKEFGVDTHIIRADFLHGREIYDGIAEGLKDKDIGVLVNNVGFGASKKFISETEERLWRYVNVNVASVVSMTKLVLPQMLARKCGAIINISSVLGVLPVPYCATYAATKAFVSSFSQAMEFEYRQSGITVQTVEPCVVSTKMTADFYSSKQGASWTVASADAYVSSALSTLGYNKITSGTWSHALQHFLAKQCNKELAMYGCSKLLKKSDGEDSKKAK